jgi:hypothetical protein
MGTAAGILILVAFIAAYAAYCSWLTRGIKPRVFTTTVKSRRLRTLFEERVARAGWKIVDDGNPMVAQSPLVTGIRQQISLDLASLDSGRTRVRIGPTRWVTKWGVPKKAHTIRMRINSFTAAVHGADPSVHVTLAELRGR